MSRVLLNYNGFTRMVYVPDHMTQPGRDIMVPVEVPINMLVLNDLATDYALEVWTFCYHSQLDSDLYRYEFKETNKR